MREWINLACCQSTPYLDFLSAPTLNVLGSKMNSYLAQGQSSLGVSITVRVLYHTQNRSHPGAACSAQIKSDYAVQSRPILWQTNAVMHKAPRHVGAPPIPTGRIFCSDKRGHYLGTPRNRTHFTPLLVFSHKIRRSGPPLFFYQMLLPFSKVES